MARALRERGSVEAWLYGTGPEDREYHAVGRVTLREGEVAEVGDYVPARMVRAPG